MAALDKNFNKYWESMQDLDKEEAEYLTTVSIEKIKEYEQH